MMQGTGVLKRSLSLPKNDLGSTPSRPIAYSRRDALACADRPEVNWPTISPSRKMLTKMSPPMFWAIS
ncbi:hypothetical protein D3C85_1902000 [compost metagenome]